MRVVEQLRSQRRESGARIEGIVMTMFDSRTNLAQQVVEEVRKHFGDKVYETLHSAHRALERSAELR